MVNDLVFELTVRNLAVASAGVELVHESHGKVLADLKESSCWSAEKCSLVNTPTERNNLMVTIWPVATFGWILVGTAFVGIWSAVVLAGPPRLEPGGLRRNSVTWRRAVIGWICAVYVVIFLMCLPFGIVEVGKQNPVVFAGIAALIGRLFVLGRYRTNSREVTTRLDLPDRILFIQVVEAPRGEVKSRFRAVLGM